MSTALTTFDPQLPAYLQQAHFMQLNARMGAGLTTGAPPRVSFRGSRFRLVSADGEETLVQENGGTTLDVVVLDGNEGVSKFYYANKYDPNADGDDAAPSCFSEDGKSPSARSAQPQSRSCASCPLNAWGSKISEASGKKIKACSDAKKLAVIPVGNLAGDAYVINIPGASLKAWSSLVTSTSKRGVPISAMVIRLGFNPQTSFPQLTFAPVSFMTQDQYTLLADLFGSPDLDQLVGRGDAPHQGPFVQDKPGGQPLASAPAAQGPAVQFVAPQPVAAAPMGPPPGMAMPAHTGAAMAQQPAAEQAAPAATRRRGRPAAPNPAQQPVQAAPSVVPQAAQQPVQAAPSVVPQAAQQAPAAPASVASLAPTSNAMDALLAQVMGQ